MLALNKLHDLKQQIQICIKQVMQNGKMLQLPSIKTRSKKLRLEIKPDKKQYKLNILTPVQKSKNRVATRIL